jgi:carboxypeptidase Taq
MRHSSRSSHVGRLQKAQYSTMEAYGELVKVFTRLHNLGHLSAIANWDAMVNMPPKGAEARGAALAELDVISHNIVTDKKIQDLLRVAQGATKSLSVSEQANLREMHRHITKETKLPESLVERKAVISSRAEQAWRQLRPQNDWDKFLPHLKDIIDLSREMAKCLAVGTDLNPYEALMDMYEPGMRVAVLDRVFDDVKSWLPALIKEVMAANESKTIVEPKGPFPIAQQKELGLDCMRTWKFDFDAGRLDVSSHPFCGGVPEDVRLTTRYREENFDQSLMGIIHETGHAKYEQNRPRDLLSQPGSQARSMGVHESQSLFAEMQIGRSSAFAKYLTPLVMKHLGDQPAFTAENLTSLAHRVRPGLIRVDADELCYPLHVILRYEIERALIEGTLEVEGIPEQWNSKMKEYLGQDTTGNFKDGPLQDIHWSIGAVGYFPTYTLGAMYAAQLMAAARRDLGDDVVRVSIESGDLEKILNWQREHVWQHGSLLETDDLIRQATGEPLNPIHYRRHLESRYRDGKY